MTPNPDPLHVEAAEPIIVARRDPMAVIAGCLVIVATAAIVALLLVFLLPAASRSGSLPPPSVVALTGTPPVWSGGSGVDASVASVEVSPSEVGGVPISALLSGRATWYCGNGSPCTRGYGPDDMVAAIDPTTGIDKGERVTVRHGGRSVTVRIVDVCACGGSRVIDLTSGAFRRLAPLSRGVIAVELEFGGPAPTLPPTDTIVDNFLRWGIDKYTHR
jgi:hypothetical protein